MEWNQGQNDSIGAMVPALIGNEIQKIAPDGNTEEDAVDQRCDRRKGQDQKGESVEHVEHAILFLPERAVFGVAVVLVEGEVDERVLALEIPDAVDEPDHGQHNVEQGGRREERIHTIHLHLFPQV